MNKDQIKSLQERVVKEINSTYDSIIAYKNYTKNSVLSSKIAHKNIAEKRIQIVEDKLKALKIILARIDNGNLDECANCKRPIVPQNPLLKRPRNRFCEDCLPK